MLKMEENYVRYRMRSLHGESELKEMTRGRDIRLICC